MAKKTEIVAMPKAEAQRLVKEILADATNLAAKLRELRERQGWRSLGYKTWAELDALVHARGGERQPGDEPPGTIPY